MAIHYTVYTWVASSNPATGVVVSYVRKSQDREGGREGETFFRGEKVLQKDYHPALLIN